ncbi:MAG: zinc ribbon domain-containing protein [Prevotella sp.]|nr:zinc ribbon domain-containing protein [Prevotella sp.]
MALIKCPECGQMVSDKTPACPNCGSPLPGRVADSKKDESGHWVVAAIVGIVFLLGLVLLIMTNTAGTGRSSSNTRADKVAAVAPATTFTTVDDVRRNIEGTVWTYTEIIGDDDSYDRWCRLRFDEGRLLFYEVSPSKGEWGEPHVCDYEVEEARYSNTGERYIRICWHGPLVNYSFVPETASLYWQSSRGSKFGAYLKQGDCFPWN